MWGEVRCGKCLDPPTCDCFVSSTDVQEGAGPSGLTAPSPGQLAGEDPHTRPESSEEVEGEEFDLEEDVMAGNALFILEESSPRIGSSQASIRGSPSHSSPNRAPLPRGSPSPRPQA